VADIAAAQIAESDPLTSLYCCAAEDIFDRAAWAACLEAQRAKDASTARTEVLAFLKAARLSGRTAIADGFRAEPRRAHLATRAYTHLTDCLVKAARDYAQNIAHPNPTPTDGERLAVMAVGGYGRGEMAPHSDVDLLFLTPYKVTPWAESVIETMLYLLWDLKLKVGHSSRTIRDCLRLGQEDFTIRTAMLEHRFIDGDTALAQELEQRLWDELFKGTAKEYIEAKLAERDARHKRQGQRYMVEPNVT